MAIDKVKLPDNSVEEVRDSRIPGIDSTPTSGSGNLVTSGGVKTAVDAKEDTANKVTSLSSSSTDTQYPSALCVYNLIGDIETLINAL